MKDGLTITALGVALVFVLTAVDATHARVYAVGPDRDIHSDDQTLQLSDYANNHLYNVGNHDGLKDRGKKQKKQHHLFGARMLGSLRKGVSNRQGGTTLPPHRPTPVELGACSHGTGTVVLSNWQVASSGVVHSWRRS